MHRPRRSADRLIRHRPTPVATPVYPRPPGSPRTPLSPAQATFLRSLPDLDPRGDWPVVDGDVEWLLVLACLNLDRPERWPGTDEELRALRHFVARWAECHPPSSGPLRRTWRRYASPLVARWEERHPASSALVKRAWRRYGSRALLAILVALWAYGTWYVLRR